MEQPELTEANQNATIIDALFLLAEQMETEPSNVDRIEIRFAGGGLFPARVYPLDGGPYEGRLLMP